MFSSIISLGSYSEYSPWLRRLISACAASRPDRLLRLDARRPVLIPKKAGGLLHDLPHHVEVVCVDFARFCRLVQFDQGGQVVEERRRLGVSDGGSRRWRFRTQEVPLGPFLQLVAQHVEEQRVVCGDDRPSVACRLRSASRQVVRHGHGVVLVQRGDRVVDVDVLDPLVRLGLVQHELTMARKKHQMKMFSSPRETLMSSTVSACRRSESRARSSPPTHRVDAEIEVGVAVQ